MEAASLYARARVRERRGKNDSIADGQGVRGMWLGEIDVNPFVSGKGARIEPRAMGEKCVAAEGGDGGLEMEAALSLARR